MPTHKTDYDKVAAIKQNTKNKISSQRREMNDSSSWLMSMTPQEITSIQNQIIQANETITSALIKDTQKYWKEERNQYDAFIKKVNSTKITGTVSANDVMSEVRGTSTTSRTTAQMPNIPVDSIPKTETIDRLTKGLDAHAKSFQKSSAALSSALSGLGISIAASVRDAIGTVRERYNNINFATGGGDRADEIYNALAKSNKELALELGAKGVNSITPQEITAMNKSVTTYFKKDSKMISDMSELLVQAAETGMTMNTEFLKTSAYIYKQSGKNEKALKSVVDSIYKIATETENASLEDIQNIAVDAMDLGNYLAGKMEDTLIRENPGMSDKEIDKIVKQNLEDFWKEYTASQTAIIESNSEYGDDLNEYFKSLTDQLSHASPLGLGEMAPLMETLTGYDPEYMQELLNTDYEKYFKIMMQGLTTITERKSDLELESALGLDPNSPIMDMLHSYSGDYESLIKDYQDKLSALEEESVDSVKKAIEDQKVSTEENLSNTTSELLTNSIEPNVADILDNVLLIYQALKSGSFMKNATDLLEFYRNSKGKTGSSAIDNGLDLADDLHDAAKLRKTPPSRLPDGTKIVTGADDALDLVDDVAKAGGKTSWWSKLTGKITNSKLVSKGLSGLSKAGNFLSKAEGPLAIAALGYQGITAATNDSTIRSLLGDNQGADESITAGDRISAGAGAVLGGQGKGSLQGALAQAAAGASVGSLGGPLGTLVGALIGGVGGLAGGDTISQAIDDHVMQPLNHIGESLEKGGDGLISSLGELVTSVPGMIEDTAGGVADTLKDIPVVGGLFHDAVETGSSMFGMLESAGKGLFDTGQSIADWVTGNGDFDDVVESGKSAISDFAGTVDDTVESIPLLGDLYKGLKDSISDNMERSMEKASEAATKLKDDFEASGLSAEEYTSRMMTSQDGLLGKFGSWIGGLFGGGDNKKSKEGAGGYSSGVPTNIPNIGTTKPNGDIDGPSPWIVTAGFHDYSIGYGSHDGVDYGVPRGTQVPSVVDGTVTYVTENDGSNWGAYGSDGPGKGVIVTDGQGRQHWYWHLSRIGVSNGQKVSKGTLIGLSGNTGMSTGPHLHYGLKVNGVAVNPNVTAPGLWGAVTGGSLSSDSSSSESSAEPEIKNYITTSDGGKFRMDYDGGVPNHILAKAKHLGMPKFRSMRSIGSPTLSFDASDVGNWTNGYYSARQTNNFNVNNQDVVSELRQMVNTLSYKLDIVTRAIYSTGNKQSPSDFSLQY